MDYSHHQERQNSYYVETYDTCVCCEFFCPETREKISLIDSNQHSLNSEIESYIFPWYTKVLAHRECHNSLKEENASIEYEK